MRPLQCTLALYLLALAAAQHHGQLPYLVGAQFHTARAPQRQQGSTGPEHPGAEKPSDIGPAQLTFSQTDRPSPDDSLSASDLYSLALSLLDTLTALSVPSLPAPYPPALQPTASSTSFYLDSLESRLSGSTPGAVVYAVRRATSVVFSGDASKRKAKGGRDWSVGGAVKALRGAVRGFVVAQPRPLRQGSNKDSKSPKKGWKEKLQRSALKGGIVLDEEETVEGMLEVVELARQAGEKGSAEAWLLLGDIYLTGHLTLPSNTSAALEAYTQASEHHGSPEAQYKLGFLYGSNFGAATSESEGAGQQGSALVHYTFSALAGNVPASMSVGYRHWAGIGTKQSCTDALPWYKAAAEAAMRSFNAGPPGGRHLPPQKIRLSDLQGGTYGPGASSVRSTLSTGGSTAQTQQEWDDLIEFHLFHAERGDAAYIFRLGRLYYQGFGAGGLGGVRNLPRGRLSVGATSPSGAAGQKLPGVQDNHWDGGRDFGRASRWFLKLGRKYWPNIEAKEAQWNPTWGPMTAANSKVGAAPRVGFYDAAKDKKNDKADEQTAMVAGLAAGYLGRMFMRGEGVGANYAKAFLWFQRGRTQEDRESANGLGVMYRDGLGVERDMKKAIAYFQAAAQHDLAEAQVNLGKYHFGIGDFATATTYFEHAIRSDDRRQPDQFQSYFYLAELAARSSTSPGGADSCPIAVSFYKRVAEKADWDHEVWWEAERARERGDERTAMLGYWIMADRGYEAAQNNLAWLLDRDKTRFRVPFLDAIAPSPSPATRQLDRLALTYWTRSAAQDNVDALVKTGDYYYSGIGTEDGLPQYEKAAGCYQSAATSRMHPLAMWSWGWMHETGKGVPQDFHLAKRQYDMALEISLDAYLPTTLSLVSLYSRALYHALFSSGEDEAHALSLFGKDADPNAPLHPHAYPSWTFGRAWRDIQRNWGIDPGPEPEVVPIPPQQPQPDAAGRGATQDATPAQPVQEPNQAVQPAQRALEGNEDPVDWQHYQDGRGYGQGRVGEEEDEFYVEEEGDFGGTVAIVALCMILAWLLYFRQQPHGNPPQQQAQPAPRVPAATPAPPAPAQQPQVPHTPAATAALHTPAGEARNPHTQPQTEQDQENRDSDE
ncbi:hypothetical protein JCM11641_005045 [Rhodosporidiobolus odoratus]